MNKQTNKQTKIFCATQQSWHTLREVQEVEGGVEDLVARAHAEEDRPGGVVRAHDGVLGGVV